ncbi:MAG: hypothetical protein ACRDF6_14145, partial [bacterium]
PLEPPVACPDDADCVKGTEDPTHSRMDRRGVLLTIGASLILSLLAFTTRRCESAPRDRTRAELEPFLMKEEEMPDDPPPSKPPPPVPGGTEDITRGELPGTERRS